ncbi:hypothetical protein HNO88_001578 [Novosphingobium chloroacetimidivorans]|uniref:Tail assembly chaperone n=1 Tax=Novosphingobium chloroacetimidivorans TaxID=1428314 RepID=A0A7W7NWB6_9SPHN|nr:hypothetical protein [Novosphingobium chloroacetimidivorans]MBB4858259.1 hypothetical protein [Novosphingobium chloroacetimidivorans]
MPLNITSKRVSDVCDLPVKDADGTPMTDDNGNAVTATVFGPGTKIWTVADATRRRKAIKRSREANGKFEAALNNEDEDSIDFLCAITKRFNNLEFDGVHGDQETVRAVYSDPLLGFIRDHMEADTKNWENFMKASQANSNSGSDNSPG